MTKILFMKSLSLGAAAFEVFSYYYTGAAALGLLHTPYTAVTHCCTGVLADFIYHSISPTPF